MDSWPLLRVNRRQLQMLCLKLSRLRVLTSITELPLLLILILWLHQPHLNQESIHHNKQVHQQLLLLFSIKFLHLPPPVLTLALVLVQLAPLSSTLISRLIKLLILPPSKEQQHKRQQSAKAQLFLHHRIHLRFNQPNRNIKYKPNHNHNPSLSIKFNRRLSHHCHRS